MHLPALYGCLNIVKALLDIRITLIINDSGGDTALHFSTKNGYLDIVRCLLKNGNVKVDAQNNTDFTALHLAISYGNSDTDVVQALLDKRANHLLQDNNGCTPLHYAC
ncbi:ankyrin repeat domain-containing protein [Wolbachia endosymbiont of Brugia malayi]|uniref:ankyrin repeat domain-containing protein n=1 Tax=Wolbachia endosymbiont of Brugia malayi TaxID=80849 RepID=UPI00031CDB2F|nr:ankyrin repeat domain-containing protein [Wolbachia endosymbiont of Brugia malayi]QCB61940.1 ankyrin repeat domain-containing protein [Wolbachia endosymbiont of Brugia malayi]